MRFCVTPRTSISEISDNVDNKCSDEADQVGASSAKLNVEHSAAMTVAATGGGRIGRRGEGGVAGRKGVRKGDGYNLGV